MVTHYKQYKRHRHFVKERQRIREHKIRIDRALRKVKDRGKQCNTWTGQGRTGCISKSGGGGSEKYG